MKYRNLSVDGLRGFAALVVVMGHFFEKNFIKDLPVINLITDTKLAVAIFFTLSGFVLYHNNDTLQVGYEACGKLFRKVIARFVRLSVPVMFVTVVVYCAHPYILPADDPSVYWNVFVDMYKFQPYPIDVIYYPTIDVFLVAEFTRNYIPPSWTLRPELFCSIFIFLIPWSRLNQSSWKTATLLLLLASILVMTYGFLPFFFYLGFFIAGAAIRHIPDKVPYLLQFTLLLLSCKTLLNFFDIRALVLDFFCAFLLVIVVNQCEKIAALFQSQSFLFLGKVSYPLYLIHVPLIAIIVPRLADAASALQLGPAGTISFIFVMFLACVLTASRLMLVFDIIAMKLGRLIKP